MGESRRDRLIRLIKDTRRIARDYGVKVRFTGSRTSSLAIGSADTSLGIIWMNAGISSESTFLSVFFHELQHILNYRNGKYPAYHGCFGLKKSIRAAVSHGIQAERYTDKEASKLFSQYYPKLKYEFGYNSKEAAEAYKVNLKMYLEDI